MPNEVNIGLLRYQADNIPIFDGNSKHLHRFIRACENLLHAFQDRQDPNAAINTCLLDTIFSKLKGRAADLICSRSELSNWASIKNTLLATFSDNRGIDCLIHDLISIKPLKNEDLLSFGARIQDARSLLFLKLNLSDDNAQTKLIKIEHYDQFALKTYINGLPYYIQLAVRLKMPNSLETAMSYVREELDFNQFKARQFPNSNTIQKPNNASPLHMQKNQSNNSNNYKPNLYPNFSQSNQSAYPQFQFRQPFYQQPSFNQSPFRFPFNQPSQNQNFSNQPGPSAQNFLTPRPYFPHTGAIPKSNVFKPQNKPQFNRPVPMDTSSSNIRTQNSRPPNNPARWTSQELFNQEIANTPEKTENTYESNPETYEFDQVNYNDYYNVPNEYYNDSLNQCHMDPHYQSDSFANDATDVSQNFPDIPPNQDMT